MTDTPWDDRIRAALARVVDEGRWRAPREFDALGPTGLLEGGRVVSFASNDYLGLSLHPAVVAAAQSALARWGAGSGASRLVTGSRPVHGELEGELAEWKGTEAAVTFPTGFAANLGVLCTLGGPGRAHPLGRAEPRQHHRRVSALPLIPRRLPPPRHGPPRGAAV